MNTELNVAQLTDQALFLPAFLVVTSLLIGLYVLTAPPGGSVAQALVATAGPVVGGGWIKVALLGL